MSVLSGHVAGGGRDAGSDATACGSAPCSTSTSTPSIAVVGGAVADITARPATGRLTSGGSVPGSIVLAPGGVGRNMAAAAARLLATGGAQPKPGPVALVSAVGDDALGSAVLASLPAAGLGGSAATVAVVRGGTTPAVSTLLDGGGEVAASVADFEGGGGSDNAGVLATALGSPAAVSTALRRAGVGAATLIAADGNLPPLSLAALHASAGRVDLFEPVSVAKAWRAIVGGVQVGLATPNAAELRAMARGAAGGMDGDDAAAATTTTSTSSSDVRAAVAALAPAARALLHSRWARGLVVTLGDRGAVYLTCEGEGSGLPIGPGAGPPPPTLGPLRACHVPALGGVVAVSTVGAGDALAGGLLAAAAAGAGVEAALGLGASAAAQVVAAAEAAPPLDVRRAGREGTQLARRAVWWTV